MGLALFSFFDVGYGFSSKYVTRGVHHMAKYKPSVRMLSK